MQLPEHKIALIALRLTFGGMPGPFEWGFFSEPIYDLALHLLTLDGWDPVCLFSPDATLVPEAKFLDDEIPLAEAKELIVDLPVDDRGYTDLYIDDTIGITVAIPGSNNIERLSKAILLAIFASARPRHENEPIPREEMAALTRLLAEAGPEEIKIILGWSCDFRRMLICLPENNLWPGLIPSKIC